MRPLLTLLLLSGNLCLLVLGTLAPSEGYTPGGLTNEDILTFGEDSLQEFSYLPKGHDRVLRQIGAVDGFSLMALGVFSAFVKYMAYHFITKNAGEGDGRALEDNLLDLTRITSCLTEEQQPLLANFHLHCFFPSFFSREDNDIISGVIWGSSYEDLAQQKPFPKRTSIKSAVGNKQISRGKYEPEETRSHRVRRKPAGTIISMLSLAAFGAFFFYFLFFNINKYLGGEERRSFSPSDPIEEYLRHMTSILQCLEEDDFAPRFQCFMN